MPNEFLTVWWIVFLPLLGFLFQALLGKKVIDTLGAKFGKPAVGAVAVAPIGLAFLLGVDLTSRLAQLPEHARAVVSTLGPWISVQGLQVPFELRVDPLSMTMVLIITGIGALIHLYAAGYMAEEKDYPRFFTYLNLFVAAMLVLVLGNNLVLTFVGWEGVGVCSYLLIGFWYKDLANSKAANKAFIVNRVGDAGFALGMFWIVHLLSQNRDLLAVSGERWLSYDTILSVAPQMLELFPTALFWISILLFIGAMGKSAQFPLYVWLPDAMAGPTPVSALIHAATMVTSGVYLLNRMSPWISLSPAAMGIIAIVGAVTALVGAAIAFGQTDIKKVLAYSTVSQLGYMFIACGVGAFWAGMFHVLTHAFFKALLFLGSGAVIYAMAHQQDMRYYGNLRRYLPITFATMAVGWAAIVGVPFLFSGFWSKEAVLGAAVNHTEGAAGLFGLTAGQLAGWVGFLVAAMTAFYMTRMMVLTFGTSEERWKDAVPAHHHEDHHASHGHGHSHAHHSEDEEGFFYSDAEMERAAALEVHEHHHDLDSNHRPREVPWMMWVPLVLLAIGSLGFVGSWLGGADHRFEAWLTGHSPHGAHGPVPHNLLIAISAVAFVGGVGLAFWLYAKKTPEWEGLNDKKWNPLQLFARRQFGIDALLSDGSVKVGGILGTLCFAFDRYVVDGIVNGVGVLVRSLGGAARQAQTGYVRTYAMLMQFGAVAVVAYVVYRIMVGAPQ
ncbi:MAG: NADH-quinone oxidoreductase subunit L [Fimbriimonadaceae bacterium]